MSEALTIRQVARRWGVHPKTVIRMIDHGRLESFRVGRLVRVKPTAVARVESPTHHQKV